MYLYHLTLQLPSTIPHAIAGNFSDTSSTTSSEVCIVRGPSIIELFSIDAGTGKMASMAQINTFSSIRSICSVRPVGDERDLLVVGSDSGVFVVLEHDGSGRFKRLVEEPFGRSGARRTIPGQYVAADPKGRAVMVAAVDNQKLVYILHREDDEAGIGEKKKGRNKKKSLTVSSPIEVHSLDTVLFDLVALDQGFDNPVFAALQVDYGELDDHTALYRTEEAQKVVSFYEVDLGISFVRVKAEVVVDRTAGHLVPLPCIPDGPGGLLVCSKEAIQWIDDEQNTQRVGMPSCSGMITAHAVVRTKKIFFVLLLDEHGDIFKLSIDQVGGKVSALRLRYFDSVEPCSSMVVLKQGFLFAATEFAAQHTVYQIQELGDHVDEPEARNEQVLQYSRRPLRNISAIDTIPHYGPCTDATVLNLGSEETPQIYAAQGRGTSASLSILRHGLQVSEVAVSPLPEAPSGIWTLRESHTAAHDTYIVISYANSTTVLMVDESIEEVTETAFLLDRQTFGIYQLADDSFIQVHERGIRSVRPDGRTADFKIPSGARVEYCTANARQIVLSTDARMLIYYELDMTSTLKEVRCSPPLPESVCSLHIGFLPEGRQRSHFLAIGCADDAVRVLSLNPEDCLEPLSVQALTARPASVLLATIDKAVYLFVGLANGIVIRMSIDSTGAMKDARSRLVGGTQIRLAVIEGGKQGASVLAMCTRSWLTFSRQGRLHTTPLFYEPFQHATSFKSPSFPAAIVGTSGASLRIVTVDNVDVIFNRHAVPLPQMARKVAFDDEQSRFLLTAFNDERNHLQLFNPYDGSLQQLVSVEDGTVLSATFCKFHSHPGELFFAVGVARAFQMLTQCAESNEVRLFRRKGEAYEFVHSTQLAQEEIPYSMIGFDGRLLVGVGRVLRLYDVGRKRLLRKCETRLSTHAVSIQSQGRRLFIADAFESIHCLLYLPDENRFFLFADDTIPRMPTTFVLLDHDTVAVGDKFGSFAVLRVPAALSEDLDSDPTASRANEKEVLHGAPNKLERLCEFHVGDTITGLGQCTLAEGARPLILYTTVSGAIGCFLPITHQSTALFLQNLELALRNPGNPITSVSSRQTPIDTLASRTASLFPTARDHLHFRSAHAPSKAVIDGDLCELFSTAAVDEEWRRDIADGLEVGEAEIVKRTQDMRTAAGF